MPLEPARRDENVTAAAPQRFADCDDDLVELARLMNPAMEQLLVQDGQVELRDREENQERRRDALSHRL